MAKIDAQLVLDTKDAKKGVDSLKSAFKGLVAAASVQQFVALGDEFTQITNRLKSVSSSTAEASQAFELVKKVAADTRSGLEPVAGLFADLTIATEEMGLSQKEVAAVAGTFSKALKVSGADANASSGAIRQFGQALASGVLRGDEFNSIMEANPAFMRKMAGALGVTTGQLRSMAEQGLLTSDVLVAATQEIGDSIDQDFAKTVSTVGEAFVALKNSFIEIIGRIESNTGVFTSLANTITHVADNLDVYIKLAALAFGVGAIKGVMNFVKAIQALQIVTKAQAVAQAALLALSGPAGWGILAGAAAATAVAVVGINKALGETEDAAQDAIDSMGDGEDAANKTEKSQRKVTTELEKQVDANKDGILQAKEIVQLNILLQAEKKKQKAIDDENARILANQMEDYKAITGELELGREELETQLSLQNDLLTANDNQKAVIQAVADLEAQRADDLRALATLTQIDADERKIKEDEINEEYKERIQLTKDQLLQQQKVNDATATFRQALGMLGNLTGTQSSLIIEQDLLKANTKLVRDRFNLELSMMQPIMNARIKLDQDIGEARLAEAKKQNKDIKDLTQDEEDAILKKFSVEQEAIDVATRTYEKHKGTVLEMYDEMIAKSRTFGAGIKEAFIEFEDTVNNAANFGRTVFDTMTQGWEDAFVKFAETGKLSFKDLFKTLMVEIIKLMANKLFLALFSPMGGLFGGLFAGFFNQGGTIPAGKIGIAGENGPEIIKGPGSVISTRNTAEMLGGGVTNVYYRIEATDPASFQAQIARNPEFIYNVTRAGARRTPG